MVSSRKKETPDLLLTTEPRPAGEALTQTQRPLLDDLAAGRELDRTRCRRCQRKVSSRNPVHLGFGQEIVLTHSAMQISGRGKEKLGDDLAMIVTLGRRNDLLALLSSVEELLLSGLIDVG